MFEGNFYAIMGLTSACVCYALKSSNNRIYEKDNKIRSYFSFLLINYIFMGIVDSVWGFMNTGTLDLGRAAFVIASFLIHFMAVFTAACWCIFLTSYFGFGESRVIMIIQCIPLAIALGLLATQIGSNTIFVIDESCNYASGPLRRSMFYIQYSYYIIAFLKIVYFLIKNHKEYGLRYKILALGCSIIPVGFGVLQDRDPDAPYTTLGMMFSVIVVFNGMMVIEKIRKSKKYETISREAYETLEAISEGYVATAMIDLQEEKIITIKTTPYAESFFDDSISVRQMLLNVFVSGAKMEYKAEMEEFCDIATLPERMENHRSISTQYCSGGIGWCILSFTEVERDEKKHLKKVALALQSIDEFKRKEHEFEDALSRAYMNENAILAELIMMQSVGVIASDENRIVLVANDAILKMFRWTGEDPRGKNIFDVWNEDSVRLTDDVRAKYIELEKTGGSFEYEAECTAEDEDGQIKYLKAESKRADLLDGRKIMITCFTDITQSKILEEKLRMLSETDSLTRIPNRRCGESQIRLLIEEGIPGIFCLLDINGFKKINDTYGHKSGDDVIVAVANAIKASFRSNDIFMRLGGDEFAVYMRGVTKPELARIRIARLFENIARIELENIPKGSINISLGAVIVNDKDGVIDEDYSGIYRRADAEMYKCKRKAGSSMSIEEKKKNEES